MESALTPEQYAIFFPVHDTSSYLSSTFVFLHSIVVEYMDKCNGETVT